MSQQRGVALISVMLVVAIATIAAIAMASRQHVDIRRSSNIVESDQAYLFALGVESWAQKILEKDLTESKVDILSEDWAATLPPLTVEGAIIAGRIDDQTGRLNLNNLLENGKASEVDVARMKRLFNVLGLPTELVSAIVDWIDSDETAIFPDGAEDNVYLGKAQPYRTSNTIMISPSELLLINGIDRKIFTVLSPYVSTLPQRTPVNVNTSEAPVLMALIDGLSKDEAKQLINERGDDGFESIDVFKKNDLVVKYVSSKPTGQNGKTEVLDEKTISVSSDYFMIYAQSNFGRAAYQMISLVERSEKGANVVMRTQESF